MGHNAESRKRAEEKRRALRDEWIANSGGCRVCGTYNKIHLHHKDPNQKVSHSIWTWGKEKREAEIAKCIPMCEEHHHGLHRPRKAHGTSWSYQLGCRCEECRRAVNEVQRRYRTKKWGTTSSKPRK